MPFSGESRGRRQSARHHIETSAAAHRAHDTSNPFSSNFSKQFSGVQGLQQYVRDPVKRQYRRWMRVKSPYRKG